MAGAARIATVMAVAAAAKRIRHRRATNKKGQNQSPAILSTNINPKGTPANHLVLAFGWSAKWMAAHRRKNISA
jgi:hypothetical protein